MDQLQLELGLPLPEMVFGNDRLEIKHTNGLSIVFDAKKALEKVDSTSSTIKVSMSEKWLNQRSEQIKSFVKPYDWTYTTGFSGEFTKDGTSVV